VDQVLRIGSAAVCLTPPVGVYLQGQFNRRIMKEVHDHLYAKALVIDDGSNTVAIVSCDLVSVTRVTAQAAREQIARIADIPPEHVLICATHTHDGPVIRDAIPPDLAESDVFPSGFTSPVDHDYLALLPRQIASAVCLAKRHLVEARIGIGSGREERAAFNRRGLGSDGNVYIHSAAPAGVEIIGVEGPIDPEVGVLFAENPEGQLLAALVDYTCHPTAAGHEHAASADFCGYLTGTIARAKAVAGEVLFVNGAQGNIAPVERYSPDRREYGYHRAEYIGTLIAAEALRVIELTEPRSDLRVWVTSEIVNLPMREIPAEQIAEARRALEDPQTPTREKVYAQEVLLLDRERQHSAVVPVEIQVLAVGDTAFVGVPFEMFVELGLEIKARSPFAHTFIIDLANGSEGYLPTLNAFKKGGYEVRLARGKKIVPEGGAMLVEAALRVLGDATAKE
ncbi:MAG: hypothetical protein ACRDIY_12290, partial [Chloroflexota bacterium]